MTTAPPFQELALPVVARTLVLYDKKELELEQDSKGTGSVEYLVVRFVRSRRVKVDGDFLGRTGDLLEIERGTHVVTLGHPPNFTPDHHTVRLRNTTEFAPRQVTFEEV